MTKDKIPDDIKRIKGELDEMKKAFSLYDKDIRVALGLSSQRELVFINAQLKTLNDTMNKLVSLLLLREKEK